MKLNYIRNVVFAFLLVFVLTSVYGCKKGKVVIDKSPKNTLEDSKKTSGLDNSSSSETDNANNPNSNIDIPDFISKRILLGTYSEIIRLGGSKREPKKILFNNGTMIFPEGKVATITTKTNGTRERFLNISSDEVKDIISVIETSKIIDQKLLKKNVNQAIGAELNLILFNTSAQYIKISIVASSDNNHWLRIDHEYDSVEDISDLCIQSEALTEKIKKLAGWKNVSNKELLKAIKVTGTDLYNNLNKKFELTADELEILKIAISEAKPAVLEGACPFDLTFEATLDNGEIVHMLWADDSCGFIGIEGSAYRVSEAYSKQINDILTKKSPTPR